MATAKGLADARSIEWKSDDYATALRLAAHNFHCPTCRVNVFTEVSEPEARSIMSSSNCLGTEPDASVRHYDD